MPPPLVFAQLTAWHWTSIAAGVVFLLALVYVLRYWILIRIPLWVLSRLLYRIRIHGLENIPKSGPALMVCNHVSYIDAQLLLASIRRPIRFLIWAEFLRVFGVRQLLQVAKVIPINGKAGPRAIVKSLRMASEALANGELVCVFAEGGITRTGFILPFYRGIEKIVEKSPAPIVPVYLDHVWGSIFSYRGGKFFWKRPRKWRYPVTINFGEQLDAKTTSTQVRFAIQRLAAQSAVRRSHKRTPAHRQFVRTACQNLFRTCFIDPSNEKKPELKYYEVLVGVKIFAKRLAPILKGDPMVGVWIPPAPGGAIANIALAVLGKTSVNLNYTASKDLVQSAIRQCRIKHVLTSRAFTKRISIDPGPGVELIYLEDIREKVTSWERTSTFLNVLLTPRIIQEYVFMGLSQHTCEDLATIIFSSGSTGEPKGVMLTHANVAGNAESMIQAVDFSRKDKLLGILPFFHSFGYTVTLWVPLQVGAVTIFHPNPLESKKIGESCKKFGCTIMLSTPTFLRSYLKRCEPDCFEALRLLITGAEKLPQSLAIEFLEKFGKEPLEGYGCTECSPVVSTNVPDWQDGEYKQVGNKRGTIGQPIPGVAVKVVHKDTYEELPIDQEGLLLVYGANIMKGYLGREDLTKKKIINGWYVTGDLAKLDEDGFITITGREERFAKIGGEMVPLERVEEELHHALETNERTCAVTAIPDEKRGERIVVLHTSFNDQSVGEVLKKLAGLGVPKIYMPHSRDFHEVEEIPVLGSGKLDIKGVKVRALELANPKPSLPPSPPSETKTDLPEASFGTAEQPDNL